MSSFSQKQVLGLSQKLSPQQIQMIKLLELPSLLLEQRIKQEIEENPVLEENVREESDGEELRKEISFEEYLREDDTPAYKLRTNNYSKDDRQPSVYISGGRSLQEFLEEQLGYKELSVRALEKLAKEAQNERKDKPRSERRDSLFDEVELALTENLGRKVRVVNRGENGVLQIEFYGKDDLQALANIVAVQE